MTCGIDLSIGSAVGFLGALTVNLLVARAWPVPAVLIFTVAFSMAIGLIQGVPVTKVKIQSFIVTLTELFIYRGLSHFYAHDVTQGLGNGFSTSEKSSGIFHPTFRRIYPAQSISR